MDRSAINRALAKALAYKACGKDAKARDWELTQHSAAKKRARASPSHGQAMPDETNRRTEMKEADIMHENGDYWVARERGSYTVYRIGVTHSTSDSAYARTADGLSIAKARCNYLASRSNSLSRYGLVMRIAPLLGR